jgi:hypothetical protein
MNNGYFYAIDMMNTTQYIYSWCEQLSEIPGAPCQGEVFAQSNNYQGACVSMSGGAYSNIKSV